MYVKGSKDQLNLLKGSLGTHHLKVFRCFLQYRIFPYLHEESCHRRIGGPIRAYGI
jgi:hypothetical protein